MRNQNVAVKGSNKLSSESRRKDCFLNRDFSLSPIVPTALMIIDTPDIALSSFIYIYIYIYIYIWVIVKAPPAPPTAHRPPPAPPTPPAQPTARTAHRTARTAPPALLILILNTRVSGKWDL